MARLARGLQIDPSQVQVVHCIQRCVRRAFLCGKDPHTQVSYEHRRDWIRQRLEFLASIFAIDCLTYTVMNNHIHLVLRSRPDIIATWSDREVARRWLLLFPVRRHHHGAAKEPSQAEIDSIVNQPKVLSERRSRLCDISWWMKCTSENIARRSNKEDQVTGHFWEGRFKSQVILDEAGLLACATYVDLNPVRAALARTPESSKFTGAKDRIDDLSKRHPGSRVSDHQWERSRRCSRSAWMSPLEIREQCDPTGPDASGDRRRASDKGFLSISLSRYVELLEWTGRRIRDGKRGTIPKNLSLILARIGLDETGWCELVTEFRAKFKRAVGTSSHLATEARRRGQRWLQAPGSAILDARALK